MAEPLRNKLKTLCAVHGCSYIIFWRIHPQNSLMLTVEDVYYEDQLGEEIVNTVPQVHLIGEGIVGQAAFTGKHRWVDSDAQMSETIVVISFLPWGVIQFGSKNKILERVKFVEQIERLLRGIEDEGVLDVLNNTSLSLDCENYDLNGLLASVSSENFNDWNLISVHDNKNSASVDDSFPSLDMILEEHGFCSHLGDQLAPVTDYSMNNFIARNPSFGTCGGEISALDIQHFGQVTQVNYPDSLSMMHELSKDLLDPVDALEEFSKLFSMDDLCQLLAPSPDHDNCGTVTAALDESQEFNPSFFGLVDDDIVPLTSTVMHSSESMVHDMSCDQVEEWWGSMALLTPVVSAAAAAADTDIAFSELNVSTLGGSRKRLFSEEFPNGSNFGDQLSNNRNPKHLASHAVPKLDMSSNLAHNKVTRKKARPGESTRPRPKDRQQIQDRIGELRGIIPNGGKCSIDSLLDRTIRYMIFLQSITKYADKLQEHSEPKLIEQEKGKVLKDGGGVTCAFEVEGQTMACPIIVEDMGPPGQMLIEMIFEEQGSFLEIVDNIGGFGLNILKGKMEIKENKIWARFIVEANRKVTRIDVFWSLIHLLQQKNTLIWNGFT